MDPLEVPDACTLDPADVPARLAELDELAAHVIGRDRPEPTLLRWRLPGDRAGQARDLAGRESACCSFFAFDVREDGADVVVEVRVPPSRVAVLDGLAALPR